MSSPLAGLRPISLDHIEHTHIPFHRQAQSLSTAEGFSEIQVEPTPPQTLRTLEALNVGPAVVNRNTAPTPAALPPSFADRHPTVTNTLATCAASIAWFAGTAASLPLYILTTPVRLFATALSVISPTQGTSFTKSAAFKTLTGAMGETISIEARHGNRKTLAIGGMLDICSLGISFSAVSAIALGWSAFTKTRTIITDHLSDAKQRRLAEEAQRQAQRQAQEARDRPHADQREDNDTALAILEARPLSSQIKALKLDGPNINIVAWKQLETGSNIDTKPLSALLTKLQNGIQAEQRILSSTFPSTSTPEEAQKQTEQINNIKKAFVKRITNVLIKCQESPDLTKQVCDIALERGLASCTDRAATAWLSIEEYIDTSHLANQITQLSQNGGIADSQNTLQKTIRELLTLEHKKHLSEQLKHHLDKERHTLQGNIDYIELLLDVHQLIQKENPSALRELPYKNFSAHLSPNVLHKITNQIIDGLEHSEEHRSRETTLSIRKALKPASSSKQALLQKAAKIKAFETYLQTSEAWTSVFGTLHPHSKAASEKITQQLDQAILTVFYLPLNEGDRTQLMNLFSGFRKWYADEQPNRDEAASMAQKETILSTTRPKLNTIQQADTANIETARTLLTKIKDLNKGLFDALAETAMDEELSTETNVEQLTPFLEQVHGFLKACASNAFKGENAENIVEGTLNNMVSDLKKTEFAPARAALKQAYLARNASEILNAFNLLTPPDNTGLAKFTKEQIMKTFPEPITLRKVRNNAQG